jgi:hypothetical protein
MMNSLVHNAHIDRGFQVGLENLKRTHYILDQLVPGLTEEEQDDFFDLRIVVPCRPAPEIDSLQQLRQLMAAKRHGREMAKIATSLYDDERKEETMVGCFWLFDMLLPKVKTNVNGIIEATTYVQFAH